MELDKRIVEGKKPLDCFDTEIAKQFIGKKGFFGVHKSQFMNLDTCPKCVNEILNKIDNYDECSFVTSGNYAYMYFLPEEWVKEPEKKYRPLTLNEFQDQFHFGICIILRPKNDRSMEFHVTYNGYKVLTDRNIVELYLGPAIFTLSELYEEYERFENGRWKPFGIEE